MLFPNSLEKNLKNPQNNKTQTIPSLSIPPAVFTYAGGKKKSLLNVIEMPGSKLLLHLLLNNPHLVQAGGEKEAEQERRGLFWERKH